MLLPSLARDLVTGLVFHSVWGYTPAVVRENCYRQQSFAKPTIQTLGASFSLLDAMAKHAVCLNLLCSFIDMKYGEEILFLLYFPSLQPMCKGTAKPIFGGFLKTACRELSAKDPKVSCVRLARLLLQAM